jgi:ribosomal protein S7
MVLYHAAVLDCVQLSGKTTVDRRAADSLIRSFGRLWYTKPHAVIRVYDDAGNAIETAVEERHGRQTQRAIRELARAQINATPSLISDALSRALSTATAPSDVMN